jgi:hypothetical protein
MRNWTEMSAKDFDAGDQQLDLLAAFEAAEHGTLDLLAIETEEAPAEAAERTDGALFGLALSDEPADDALFAVIAA